MYLFFSMIFYLEGAQSAMAVGRLSLVRWAVGCSAIWMPSDETGQLVLMSDFVPQYPTNQYGGAAEMGTYCVMGARR